MNTLNRLEELDGKSEQISMEKFRMYLLMDNQEEAFNEIKSLSNEYPYDMRYQTILGYLNNDKLQEAYDTYQHILKEEPGYAPALLSMASYYQKMGQDSLYRLQLDTILLNDDVESDTKMSIMRQLILQSEQTTKCITFPSDSGTSATECRFGHAVRAVPDYQEYGKGIGTGTEPSACLGSGKQAGSSAVVELCHP